MADISVAYAIKFKNDFILRVQQGESRLKMTVRNDPDFLEGKFGYWDRIGPIGSSNIKTNRHPPTPINGTNYDRRRMLRDTRDWGDMVDRSDIDRMMKDPKSRLVENARKLFNRTIDDYVIAAATGNAYNIDQNDASTNVAFPSSQKVASASTGATLVKILSAQELLDGNEVDDEEERFYVYKAHQMTQLLNTTQTTNQFYAQIEQLKTGKIDYLAKFRFVRSERLQIDPNISGEVMNLAYAKRGIGVAPQGDPFVRVTERDDLSYNWQVYAEWEIGAARIEDECVVQVNCVTP